MSKRERDGAQGYSVPAATGQQQADMSSEILPALAEEMRAANASLDPEIAAKKAKFIQSKLKSLSADMETRFEFYVRSHFSQRSIKKILQREIECAYDDNNTFISSRDSSSSSSSAAPGSSYYGVGARGGKTDRYTGVPIITEEMAVVVNGLAKLFVGELVDTAISIMKERIHFVAATATTTGEGEDEKKRENLVHQLTEVSRSRRFTFKGLLLYTVDILFHVDWWCIRQLSCPSIIIYNITSMAYNHHIHNSSFLNFKHVNIYMWCCRLI